jgi:hypothetical protein
MGNFADENDAQILTAFYYHLALKGLLKVDDVTVCKREVKDFLRERATI